MTVPIALPLAAVTTEEILWVAGGALITVLMLVSVCFWAIQEFQESLRRAPETPTVPTARPVGTTRDDSPTSDADDDS